MHDKASEVGQALGDASLAGGKASDFPVHPCPGGRGNRLGQRLAREETIGDVIAEMATVHAFEEVAGLVRRAVGGSRWQR